MSQSLPALNDVAVHLVRRHPGRTVLVGSPEEGGLPLRALPGALDKME